MKPIFCIDITNDKKNETLNGSEFISRTLSAQKLKDYEEKQETLEEAVEKSKIPLGLTIVKYLCAFFFLIALGAVAKSRKNLTIPEQFENAPWIFIAGIACAVVWVIIQILSKCKETKILKEENAEEQAEELKKDEKTIFEELEVPSTARSVDVIMFRYKAKNDKIVPHVIGLQTTAYMCLDAKIFASDEGLNIADISSVYTFRKSEIKAIRTVKKRISIANWNKDEDPRKGEFKPYKMAVNNYGDVFFKPYHILEIERDGQLYGLYFPPYELDVFERLTGIAAER